MAEEKKKKKYLSYYKMVNKKGKPRQHTLSYAQWKKASSTDMALNKQGISAQELRRLGSKI